MNLLLVASKRQRHPQDSGKLFSHKILLTQLAVILRHKFSPGCHKCKNSICHCSKIHLGANFVVKNMTMRDLLQSSDPDNAGAEFDRHEIADLIVEEGSPHLGRCRAPFRHQTGNGTFKNFDSEFK
jgi:hypothetical protein